MITLNLNKIAFRDFSPENKLHKYFYMFYLNLNQYPPTQEICAARNRHNTRNTQKMN